MFYVHWAEVWRQTPARREQGASITCSLTCLGFQLPHSPELSGNHGRAPVGWAPFCPSPLLAPAGTSSEEELRESQTVYPRAPQVTGHGTGSFLRPALTSGTPACPPPVGRLFCQMTLSHRTPEGPAAAPAPRPWGVLWLT